MENLSFKLTLDATWHPEFQEEFPICSIMINDEKCGGPYAIRAETTIEFDHDCAEENTLCIRFNNKMQKDVVLDDEGNIIKDKLLHIKKIEIDDIDITNLCHFHSVYTPTDPWFKENFDVDSLRNHMDLGWKGTWEVRFNTPFYIWLLETM